MTLRSGMQGYNRMQMNGARNEDKRTTQSLSSARRIIIDFALSRAGFGTGSSNEFMWRRTAVQQFPDLRETLRGIDWVVVGAAATRAYMPERTTHDLDILVRLVDAESVYTRLTAAGYSKIADLGIPGAAFSSKDQIEIDVLYGNQAWLDEGLAQPERDAAGFPILGLPYLVLMKLAAGRVRDIGDVATMLGWADEEVLDKVREAVNTFSPADNADLESLIYLGRRERGLTD